MKLLIFVGMNVGSYVGWELGDHFGMMCAFIVSSIGSIVGVWIGWLVARKYLV